MTPNHVVAKLLVGLVMSSACDLDAYEVWLVDQSNSPGQTFGGALYIFEGEDLQGAQAANAVPTVVDLGAETAALCLANTGANPVRPHMLAFNADHSHGILSFVTSGHVVIFDGPTHAPLACFRADVGAGGARQAHGAFPTANDAHVVVANQNGKLLERISTDFDAGTFAQDPAATLNLATCTTPSGAPCQAAGLRPDNAPICPVSLPNGLVVVTLRGGGLFVVDPTTSPMSIVAEYDADHVSGNGCGGTIVGDKLFITSGGGTPSNLYTYEVYAFPLDGYSAENPVNTPAPVTVDSDDAEGRDAHGLTPARGPSPRFLWVADRGLGKITTYRASNFDLENEIVISDGPDDPEKLTPDLLAINPRGNRVFASLRGPNPLSGEADVSSGSQPGLGIFQVTQGGRNGTLKAVIPITNIDGGGVERGDAHAIATRFK